MVICTLPFREGDCKKKGRRHPLSINVSTKDPRNPKGSDRLPCSPGALLLGVEVVVSREGAVGGVYSPCMRAALPWQAGPEIPWPSGRLPQPTSPKYLLLQGVLSPTPAC